MTRPSHFTTWQRLRGSMARLGAVALLACLGSTALQAQTTTVVPGTAIGKNKAGNLASAADYTAYPALNASAVAPLVMLVMSRDEQLFIKAYTDYTDLDGDGKVDTTYNDNFNYSGYFDSNLCYDYGTSQFKAKAAATGTGPNTPQHRCDGTTWSGNFLNWVTMSRLDVVRFVLYGGYRFTDTATTTVLQRADIPNDLHAWAKVYTKDDVDKFTPFKQDASKPGISFCNANIFRADDPNTPKVDESQFSDPKIRVAAGNWSEWASTALMQCDWKDKFSGASDDNSYLDDPAKSDKVAGANLEYNMRVQVCDSSATNAVRESFCQAYGTSTISYKPVGLLQRYGENGQMRFGLMTGSFSAPRSGGVLRRNIGMLAGNGTGTGCATGDEINLTDGTFCSQADGNEGIVNTLNRFQLTKWSNGGKWTDCDDYSIYNRQVTGSDRGWLDNPGGTGNKAKKCSAWGNPLSEMYAEALRYLSGEGKTTTFAASGDLTGLPTPDWLDPYGTLADGGVRNPYCAGCSIIVLSTGLNSFDSDEIPAVPAIGADSTAAATATDELAKAEGISGSYLVGRVGETPKGTELNTYEDLCESRDVTKLSLVRGICPDIPSMEGSYLIGGLAYKAWTLDMRPGLLTPKGLERPKVCDANGQNCVGYKNRIQTYAVALAENLPKFTIPVGTGTITLAPLCQANNTGAAKLTDSGWRSCYLGAVGIGTKTATVSPKYIYGRDLEDNGSAGSFSLVWEDSLWGNDHDNDVVVMVSYCVGSKCSDNQQTGRKNPNGTNYTGNDICWRSDSSVCTSNNYKPTVTGSEVLVRIETLSAYAGNAMLAGYTVTGSNADGVKKLVLRPGNKNGSLLTKNGEPKTGSNNNAPYEGTWDAPKVIKYTVGSSTAKQLENPLYYAAKFGGFADVANDDGNIPTKPCNGPPDCAYSNWDRVDNNTGQPKSDGKGDGLPDTFFPVRNPAQLGERLADVFNKILARSGSGTSAAVVSSSAAGDGLTYQALYQAQQQNKSGSQKVSWTGALNALWMDANGRMRTGGYAVNGVPTMGTVEQSPVVVFCTTTQGDSRFQTFKDESKIPSGPISPSACAGQTLDQLVPVWAAQKALSQGTYATASQRTFADPAGPTNGRYILTWIDTNHNGAVDDGEQIPFAWATGAITGTGDCTAGSTVTGNFRFLNTCSSAGAQSLVNWVRGTEQTGATTWRSRTIDNTVLRLGDIINSTPLAVSTPAEAFDLLYGDKSYGSFRRVYQQRRQMIYVGANDGMIHAFNGGFYDASAHQLNTQPKKCTTSSCTANTAFTAHPLGSEVWAYVPGNLLPHLRWMTEPSYAHMFYVDGSPISQDVRIFTADTDCVAAGTTQCHPDGWGTVLIVPFRFGGGAISVDTKNATSGATTQNSFSAYVVLDITNPEAPPAVLAELTQVNLIGTTCSSSVVSCTDITKLVANYTSSVPAVAMFRPKNQANPDPSKFFLFAGSGTTDNGGVGKVEGGTAAATTALKVRAYDMANLASRSPTPSRVLDFTDTGSTGNGTTSFAGDLIASDFDLDGVAESLYFGSIKGSAVPFYGSMWAIDFGGSVTPDDWTRRSLMTGLSRPVTVRPTVGINDQLQKMVFFGTGRAFTKADMSDTQRQAIVGMVDTGTPVAFSSLFDVTSVNVDTSGNVTGAGDAIKNTTDLQTSIAGGNGWVYQLSNTSGRTTIPGERVISAQALSSGTLLTTSYVPGTDTCTDQGEGFLYGMNYRTGSPDPALVSFLGLAGNTKNLNHAVSLGSGLPSQPSLHRGGSGSNSNKQLRVCVQTSSGAIICYDVQPLGDVTSGEISWREPLTK